MLFPSGNYQRNTSNCLSAYLQLADLDQEEAGWGLSAKFFLTLVNEKDEKKSYVKGQHPRSSLLTVADIVEIGGLWISDCMLHDLSFPLKTSLLLFEPAVKLNRTQDGYESIQTLSPAPLLPLTHSCMQISKIFMDLTFHTPRVTDLLFKRMYIVCA